MQYQITDATKKTARQLVKLWDEGVLEQYFYIHYRRAGGRIVRVIVTDGSTQPTLPHSPLRGELTELHDTGLIRLALTGRDNGSETFNVTMLEGLRLAVANDFTVSDYDLMRHGNMPDIANRLTEILSEQIEDNEELRTAIQSLTTTEDKQKAGANIFKQLANSFQHGSNVTNIVRGIQIVAEIMIS
ncbi:MAG: hypothetical protein ACFE0Q_20765 [Anaerolineae bacterium]